MNKWKCYKHQINTLINNLQGAIQGSAVTLAKAKIVINKARKRIRNTKQHFITLRRKKSEKQETTILSAQDRNKTKATKAQNTTKAGQSKS